MLQNTVKLKKSNSFELNLSPVEHGSLFLCLLDVLNLMTLFIATTMFVLSTMITTIKKRCIH